MKKSEWVEHIGSGITRMRDLIHDEGLIPPEFSINGMFPVTLRRPFDFDIWVDMWENHLSEKRIAFIKSKHLNPAIRKSELEKHTGLSATAVDNNIDALKDAGLVERRN